MNFLHQWMHRVHLSLLCLSVTFSTYSISAQTFNALHFDGEDDVVTVPVVQLSAADLKDFSVQLWYQAVNEPQSAPARNLLRLYSDTRAVSFVAYGNSLIMTRGSTALGAITSFTDLDHGSPAEWHHLRMDIDGDSLAVYLDCQRKARLATRLQDPITAMVLGGFDNTPGFTSSQSWLGEVESFRLYTGALRAGMNACLTEYCVPNPDSNLLIHYDFNQGAAAGANQGILAVENRSLYSGLDGGLFNFALDGPTSNFVVSTAPLLAEELTGFAVDIRDYPYQNDALDTICSGDPVQFSLNTDQLPPGALNDVSISWQSSSDGGQSWENLTLPFDGFAFPVPPNVLTLDCDTSSTGAISRLFRAELVVNDPTAGTQCTYRSQVDTLVIRCPLTEVAVGLSPNVRLCGGDETVLDVFLISGHLWLDPPLPGTEITWTVSVPGVPTEVLTDFTDLPSFSYPYTAPAFSAPQTVTFTAALRDCDGTLRQFSTGLNVDPPPVPARLTGLPEVNPTNLTLLSPGPNPVYDICPGDDATLGERNFFNHQ
ncbi:MAG: LamG-like jellyroll fold domain-containing protein, partial [Bacteroidota bacterium]